MEILMLSNLFLPKIDGCSQTVFEQSSGLTKHGHKVYLVTRSFPQTPCFEEIEGVRVFRVKYGKSPLGKLFFCIYLLEVGLKLASENKVHIIHAYGLLSALAGFLISRILMRPFIFSILDIEGFRCVTLHIGQQPSLRDKFSLHLSRLLIKFLIGSSYKTLVTSGNAKSILLNKLKLKSSYASKIYTVHASVSLEVFHPWEIPHEGVNILYVGSLVSRKGLIDLLTAFSYVSLNALKDGEEVRLIVVGDGPLRGQLEEWARKLKIRDNVYFIGYVPHSEVPQYHALSDIFVLPSRIEAFGIALIEAMAMGKPIVATKTTGPSEIVKEGESGFLVKPGDIRGLTNALLKLLMDEKLREIMGRNGRNIVQSVYSTNAIAKLLEEIYYDSTESQKR